MPKPARLDTITAFKDLIAGKKDHFLELAIEFLRANPEIIWLKEDDYFYKYHQGCYYKTHDADIDGMLMDVKFPQGKELTAGGRKTVFTVIKTLSRRSVEDLNPEGILNFENGIFDLKTRQLMPHDMQILSSIQLPYNYDPEAKSFLWLKTLEEITEGDRNKIRTIKEFMGYCLGRSTKQQKTLWFTGNGDNGKTVILETIRGMMGKENTCSLSLKSFADAMKLPLLVNKMVNISDEIPKRSEDFENEFKMIATGGEIYINPKHVQGYNVFCYCKLIFAGNALPRIDDSTDAFYKRMLVVPLNRKFLPDEQDRDLTDKLKKELPGIFNFALQGHDSLNKRGMFQVDFAMQKEINNVKISNNPLLEWLQDYVVIDKSSELVKAVAYEHYSKWALKFGYKPYGVNKFSAEVFQNFQKNTKRDAREGTGDRRHCWPGLALRNQQLNGQEITSWEQ